MLSFFGRAQKGKPVLIADVESGSVAVAVAVLYPHIPARILSLMRTSQGTDEKTGEQMASQLPTLLGESAEKVLKKYAEGDSYKSFGFPRAVHAIVSPPFARSRTAHAEVVFDTPRPVTNDVIQKLATEALKKPSDLNTSSLFETNIVRVTLNGYGTARPLGKKAKSVGVTVFQSDIEPAMRQGIEGALGKLLPGRPVDIRSSLRAIQAVLHEKSKFREYFVITVGSESTECFAVRKDELAEHATLKGGTATLTRKLAGEKGLPEGSATIMRMMLADVCHSEACDLLKAGLLRAEPELTKQFGDTFSALAATRRIPNVCIIHTNRDFAPWYEHFFSRIDFSQFTMTTSPFRVESMTPENLTEYVSFDAGVPADSSLGVASAFLNLNFQST